MSEKKKSADSALETAKLRLAQTGRNEPCGCGSGKKYKKCHLQEDEALASPPVGPPDPQEMIDNGWRLFEQRRPGAAEKEFRKALQLKPELPEALVGVGMAKLQTGDNDGARKELSEVIKLSEPLAADLAKQGVKDAFTRKEAQAYIRASHALGCLAYDQEKYDEALGALERVYSVDEGTVGIEARLIAAKTLMKLSRAADVVPVLDQVAKNEEAGSRAQLGLALAHFTTGDRNRAEEALGKALAANPNFGKAILGQLRKRVDNPVGAAPGSREEALIYAQTYGDVWDEPAKKFLEETLAGAKPSAEDSDQAAPAAPDHDMTGHPRDRRASRRNPIQVRLEMSDTRGTFNGRSVDVSRGGIFAATSETRPVGTLLRVRVLGPRGDAVMAVGVIVRCFSDLEASGEAGGVSPGLAIALTSTSEAWDRFWDDVSATNEFDEEEEDDFDDDDGEAGAENDDEEDAR